MTEIKNQTQTNKIMYVVKRNGKNESMQFDKITKRVKNLCYGLDMKYIDPAAVTLKVMSGIYPGITTRQLDDLAAETAAFMSTSHFHYSTLAARICASNLHKETNESYLELVTKMRNYIHPKTKDSAPLVSEELLQVVSKYEKEIQDTLDEYMHMDFEYDYFAFKTLERAYLLKMDGKICERPQYLLMRVAIGMYGFDIESVLDSYKLMSAKKYTMATPTLFNSGTERPQMSSCFLLQMKEDSISGIYDTMKDCALISKHAGGIGLSIHDIRASGSYIRGTTGISNGLVNMLRVFNNTARYVDQGGGRRKGSIAIYLEPHHPDIEAFLDLKKNHGNDMERARDLFYALWISDLFMKRVEKNGKWSLFCPDEAPGLSDVYGEEFEELYIKYEKEGLAKKEIKARDLFNKIIDSQVETGTPYILFKDSVNRKTNHQNLGVIKSSNLCAEIMQYTSKDEIAVCNLASINLSSMVKNKYTDNAYFDFEELVEIVKKVTVNLNRVIDKNFYPVPEAEKSNKAHRPIGIGVQGLADAFIMMRLPFASESAMKLNREIFETMYYASVSSSIDLAEKEGSYSSYEGSPMSKGIFQFDMWGVKPSERYNWEELRQRMMKHGIRNSLLLSLMPTASSASILGNNESFEPFTSNVYNRRVLAGEFCVINKHLLKDLTDLGIWNEETKSQLMADKGSVQSIVGLSDNLKELYKTVWEIPQKVILDQSIQRGCFVCQSQSMNVHLADPNRAKMTSMLFYAWKNGLKTGMYYLRSKGKSDTVSFVNDNKMDKKVQKVEEEETCENCSA